MRIYVRVRSFLKTSVCICICMFITNTHPLKKNNYLCKKKLFFVLHFCYLCVLRDRIKEKSND